jgi:hypothetical protein
MPINFATYLTQLADALQAQNGPNLAYLLRPTSPHGKDLVKEFRNPTVPFLHFVYSTYLRRRLQRASLSYYKESLESPWDDIAIQYVLVTNNVARKRPGEAFKEQSSLVS